MSPPPDSAAAATAWTPQLWQSRQAGQMPAYRDPAALARVMDELARLPPLVTSWEIEALRAELALAEEGRAFVLQGGDCAESFDDCTSDAIVSKLKILLQMSVVIVAGLKRPVIRIGRMAGQYAKPRSADTEVRDGTTLPAYRGDLVNRAAFTGPDREPDPQLLLRAYERSALTLNFVRSLLDGGFADLHHPENWDLDWVRHSPLADEYHRIVKTVADGLDFFESISGQRIDEASRVEFFASHEGLHLYYEQAQTRFLPKRQAWYDLTTHFPWIGARTGQPDGAHVEFFSGVRNPVGVKIGPDVEPERLRALIRRLNPAGERGRLALIHRCGAKRIREVLPRLIAAAKAEGLPLLWICDPMHGNTESTASGRKTRRLENILDELSAAAAIHQAEGSVLGGVHLELTGEHVTECTGGARGLGDGDLARDYRSAVDPRLNYEQALEVAMRIAALGGQLPRRNPRAP